MRTTSIKLPEPLDGKLKAIAKQRRTTRAKVLREALEQFDRHTAGPTASELAADLVFEGPGDLSTNPKRMAGYGR
jgi:predicted transcriptional regulator